MSDLIVVGGGIVGAAVCFYAQDSGATCTLIERDSIAAHASGFAFGGLHPRLESTTSSAMSSFASASFSEHRIIHERLSERELSTWRQRSSVSLAWNEAEAQGLQAQACENPATMKWLDRRELKELETRISSEAHGGLMTSNSAEVSAHSLVSALCNMGEPVHLHTEAIDLELRGDRIVGVKTRYGDLIEGDNFIFAMGPWSTRAFAWLGLQVEITPLKGQILRLRYPGRPFEHSFSTHGNYLSSKPDGLLWAGTTEEMAEFDELPTKKGGQAIEDVLRKIIPSSDDFIIEKQTACLRPISPDGELILGRVNHFKNAFIGTGGGRKGILYGPLMGRCLVELTMQPSCKGSWPSLSPHRFIASQ